MFKALRHFEFALALLIVGCAQVKPIPGGQKDDQPPKVIDYNPSNERVRFGSKSFVITFDEYVALNNIQQELVVSPPLLSPPKVEVRKKSVVVSWKEDLLPNTTYNFQFGDGIADINEGNKAKDLQYVFATGDALDSAQCTFQVIDNNTGEYKKDIRVLLFDSDSSFFVSRPRPSHTAKTNSNGLAQFRYMQNGAFVVYGLDDTNGNYRLDDGEKVAFLPTAFDISGIDTTANVLRLCQALPETRRVDNYLVDSTGTLHFFWPKQWGAVEVRALNAQPLNQWQDSANDSVWVSLLGLPTDGYVSLVVQNKIEVSDTINVPFFNQLEDRWIPSLQKPKFLRDEVPAWTAPFRFDIQTTEQQLRLSDTIIVQGNWKLGALPGELSLEGINRPGTYKGVVLPGALRNPSGVVNDSATFEFSILGEKDLGTLKVDLSNWNIQGVYFLELIDKQNNIAKAQRIEGSGAWTIKNIVPGEYSLRIWQDINNNGIPDLTHIKTKQEAEPYSILSKQVLIRANWEIQIQPTQR